MVAFAFDVVDNRRQVDVDMHDSYIDRCFSGDCMSAIPDGRRCAFATMCCNLLQVSDCNAEGFCELQGSLDTWPDKSCQAVGLASDLWK
jgi:hypothetical protein